MSLSRSSTAATWYQRFVEMDPAAVLMVFLAGGQILMEAIGMRLGSFQIAGGIILFLFALTMIFGESKPESEIGQAERDHLDGAVFPLAMPSIASPGAMLAVVILTDNHRNSIADQAVTAGLLLLVLAFTLGLLLLATKLHRLIGRTGASIISRVMGIILATVAVDSVVGGLTSLNLIDVPAAADAPLVAVHKVLKSLFQKQAADQSTAGVTKAAS